MIEIKLTKGYKALVDDCDADLSEQKWYALESHGRVYAVRDNRHLGGKTILLHRIILERILGRNLLSSEKVDHREGIGLNNCRHNLRLATNTQNQCNRGMNKNNPSGYKGVRWHKKDKKWQARIRINGKEIYLGEFDDPIKAAKAYDCAARDLHGEFARTNFSTG